MNPKLVRGIALGVFCGGIVLLAAVFFAARSFLGQPMPPASKNPNLGVEMGAFVARAALLFIMGYAASSIAGRGVQLYQAALSPPTGTLLTGHHKRE